MNKCDLCRNSYLNEKGILTCKYTRPGYCCDEAIEEVKKIIEKVEKEMINEC